MPIEAQGHSINVLCDRCPRIEWPPPTRAQGFGRSKAAAYQDLRNQGWRVSEALCVCPRCQKKKK